MGRSLDTISRAADKAAVAKVVETLAHAKVPVGGATTAIGRDALDLAWEANLEAQKGSNASGAINLGVKSDTELPSHIRSIADRLSFGTAADGAYHAHKHAKELSTQTTSRTEMSLYLQEARRLIHDTPGVLRYNQNGSRSIVFEAHGKRAIVTISIEGNASISTYGKK